MFRFFDYPQDWNQIRREVYRKDNWVCQRCGAKNTKLYAHHLIPLIEGGSNELKNLITLCEKCHRDMHFHMRYGKIVSTLSTFLIIGYYLSGFIFRISDWAGFIVLVPLFILGFAIVYISIEGVIKTNKARRELLQKNRTHQAKQVSN